jgi:CBS domain-containing protein
MSDKKATKIAVIMAALIFALILTVFVMSSTETTGTVMVKNAHAIPPIIAVNSDITGLQVDVACINSSIDLVKMDLSPIGGNVSTIMALIGNFTEGDIEWYCYNCITNASVEGSFNLSVNATDINGNYNNSVKIMLEVNGFS